MFGGCFSIGDSRIGDGDMFIMFLLKWVMDSIVVTFPVPTGHCSAKGSEHMDTSGHLDQSCDTALMDHVVTGLGYY